MLYANFYQMKMYTNQYAFSSKNKIRMKCLFIRISFLSYLVTIVSVSEGYIKADRINLTYFGKEGSEC